MIVYHYTDKTNLDSIMQSGLKATSRYESFSELRKNVVFVGYLHPTTKYFPMIRSALK